MAWLAVWARRRASLAASAALGVWCSPQTASGCRVTLLAGAPTGPAAPAVATGAAVRGASARATGVCLAETARRRGSVRFQYQTVSTVSRTATMSSATMNHLTVVLVTLSWAMRRPDTLTESSGLTTAHGDKRRWFFHRRSAVPAQRHNSGSNRHAPGRPSVDRCVTRHLA